MLGVVGGRNVRLSEVAPQLFACMLFRVQTWGGGDLLLKHFAL